MNIGVETRTIKEVYITNAKSLIEINEAIEKYASDGYTLVDTHCIDFGIIKGKRYDAKMQKDVNSFLSTGRK